MCDFIKETFVGVVECFNGKVYNKRFTDELNKNMPPQFNWWASRDDNTPMMATESYTYSCKHSA